MCDDKPVNTTFGKITINPVTDAVTKEELVSIVIRDAVGITKLKIPRIDWEQYTCVGKIKN